LNTGVFQVIHQSVRRAIKELDHGPAQLNTAGMTLLNLDWANRSATILACERCGRIEWFLQPPDRIHQ
jgi:hypothetical protein